MGDIKNNPRLIWLLLYVVINLVCGYQILEGGELLGESKVLGLKDSSWVVPVTALVVLSYIGILGFLFPAMEKRVDVSVATSSKKHPLVIGWALIGLQLMFMAFVFETGAFVAGSTVRDESIWSKFWVIFNVDPLFFIYYGFYRSSKLFWPNLILEILSSVIRGWTGIFILVAFMEMARLVRAKKFPYKQFLIASATVLVLWPYLQSVKMTLRGQGVQLDRDASVVEKVTAAIDSVSDDGVTEVIFASVDQIFQRIHLVSSTIAVIQNNDNLSDSLDSGDLLPFWKEGIYGIALDKILGKESKGDLGVALAKTIAPEEVNINWNSNPGFLSWIFIDPIMAPIYLAYVFGLLWLSMILVKKLGPEIAAFDMLWFAYLNYLLPGWIASCVLFLNSLLLFYIAHWISDFLAKARPKELVV